MNKFTKKLYYKLFDVFQYASFLGNVNLMNELREALKIIKHNSDNGWYMMSSKQLINLGFTPNITHYIKEYCASGRIEEINKMSYNIEEWVKDLIMPGFLDNFMLGRLFRDQSIQTRSELISYINSKDFTDKYGEDVQSQYSYLIGVLDWQNYPTKYSRTYESDDLLLDKIHHSPDFVTQKSHIL